MHFLKFDNYGSDPLRAFGTRLPGLLLHVNNYSIDPLRALETLPRAALALCAALALVCWGSSDTTTAAATPFPLQAFALTGAPDSLADFQAHAQDIAVVYPTDYTCARGSGRVLGEGSPGEADAIAAYARSRAIAVMPRFSCQDGPTVHAILTDPWIRARTLGALAGIAKSPAYAGVDLDLENDTPSDRDAMSAFVDALASALHRESRRLSVDVDGVTHEDPSVWTGFYDDRAIARAADYVFVMAWGVHWEGSSPGPIAPLSYVAAVARHLASLPHARDRIVLGVPMYGLDWPLPAESSGPPPSALRPAPSSGRVLSFRRAPSSRRVLSSRPSPAGRPLAIALQYASVLTLLRATGASPTLDRAVDEPTFTYTRAGVAHRVWYMNARSIADRVRIARKYGLGAGVWRLGEEDQSLWSMSGRLGST